MKKKDTKKSKPRVKKSKTTLPKAKKPTSKKAPASAPRPQPPRPEPPRPQPPRPQPPRPEPPKPQPPKPQPPKPQPPKPEPPKPQPPKPQPPKPEPPKPQPPKPQPPKPEPPKPQPPKPQPPKPEPPKPQPPKPQPPKPEPPKPQPPKPQPPRPTGNPGHQGKGPVQPAPQPQHGLDPTKIRDKGPTIHNGGRPHSPFTPVQRVPGQEDLRRGDWQRPYHTGHDNWQYGSGYWHGGRLIVGPYDDFFCVDVWAPTSWIYDILAGIWWAEDGGYVEFPPVVINEVITIVVQEPLFNDDGTPAVDDAGTPITVPMYVNAFWDSGYAAYGYTDPVTGDWVWLTWN